MRLHLGDAPDGDEAVSRQAPAICVPSPDSSRASPGTPGGGVRRSFSLLAALRGSGPKRPAREESFQAASSTGALSNAKAEGSAEVVRPALTAEEEIMPFILAAATVRMRQAKPDPRQSATDEPPRCPADLVLSPN